MKTRSLIQLLIMLTFVSNVKGQIVKIGVGNASNSNVSGPIVTSIMPYLASRYAYVYNKKHLGGLTHGDTLRSVTFYKADTNVLNQNCFLKIYCKMRRDSSYSKPNINWVNLSKAPDCVLAYNKNPYGEFSNKTGAVKFTFSTPFVVDTSFGHNLEILIEFVQNSSQNAIISWRYDSEYTYLQFGRYNNVYNIINNGQLPDTTLSRTSNLPTIKLEFPRYNNDIAIRSVYNLKKVAAVIGNDDSVAVVVQNVGKRPSNFKIFIRSKGANANLDSFQMSLKSMEERQLNLVLKSATNNGYDSVLVWVPSDDYNSNNLKTSYRKINNYLFSHRDSNDRKTVGVGFNFSSGYSLTRFNVKNSFKISQISAAFRTTNLPFKFIVYDVDSVTGLPGNAIWISDTVYTATMVNAPVIPSVKTNGPFFVGYYQMGTTNLTCEATVEHPLAAKTHYARFPNSNWFDNSESNVFKVDINPVAQLSQDVGTNKVLGILAELNLYNPVFAPKVKVVNVGKNNQNTPFGVKMDVYFGSNLVYTSTKSVTLNAESSKEVFFDSAFKPSTVGIYSVKMYTQLGGDLNRGNDTSYFKFSVAKFYDIGVDSVYAPQEDVVFELLHDTLKVKARFKNYGKNEMTYTVYTAIYDTTGTRVYGFGSSYLLLLGGKSLVFSFGSFPCNYEGKLKVVILSSGYDELNTSNDTVVRYIYVVRKNDLKLQAIKDPMNKTILDQALLKPKCVIENIGTLPQSSGAKVFAQIKFNNNIVYADSLDVTLNSKQASEFTFKDFVPQQRGYYNLVVYTKLKSDINYKNDTLKSSFCYKLPDDVEIVSVVPATSFNIVKFNKYKTGFSIRNNGFVNQTKQFQVRYQLANSNNNIIYNKTVNLTIDSGETKVIYIDSTLVTYGGLYTIRVFSELASDYIRANDTFKAFISDSKELDVALTQFVHPVNSDSVLVGSKNNQVSVLVSSMGKTKIKDSITVKVRMLRLPSGNEFYTHSRKIVIPDSGKIVIRFNDFDADTLPTSFRVIGAVSYYGDQDQSNDVLAFNNKFMLAYDLKLESINLPFNGAVYKDADTVLTPIVYIRNTGVRQLNDFYVSATIKYFDKALNQEVVVYRDSVLIAQLNSGAFNSVNNFKPFNLKFMRGGDYTITASSQVKNDGAKSDNELQSTFKISKIASVEHPEMSSVVLFPNPNSGILNIEIGDLNYPKTALILDANGRLIKNFLIEGFHTTLDVSDFSAGVYFMKIGDGLIKFVVE